MRNKVCVGNRGDRIGLTYMVKLEMKAVEGRSTSKAASLVTASWFHTELWTVVTA